MVGRPLEVNVFPIIMNFLNSRYPNLNLFTYVKNALNYTNPCSYLRQVSYNIVITLRLDLLLMS